MTAEKLSAIAKKTVEVRPNKPPKITVDTFLICR